MSEAASNMDVRVKHVESEVGALKGQVRDLDVKLDNGFGRVFGKLDEMGRTQAAMQAQRPASWDKILAFVVHAAVLIGMGTAAILFVARGLTLELTAQMREDLAVMKAQQPLRDEIATLKAGPPPPGSSWAATVHRK